MTESFVFDDFIKIRGSIQSLLSVTRRTLHAMPEAAFSEWKTFDSIAGCAQRCGARLSFLTDDEVRRHADLIPGVKLHCSEEHPEAPLPCLRATLQLREGPGVHAGILCDIDALPFGESRDPSRVPVKSGFCSSGGCCHACAHDGHMAVCLAMLQTVSMHPELLHDTSINALSFIFECGEEGCRGASFIRDSSLLDGISELFCFHLGMGLPSGFICPSPDGFLATEKYSFSFRGRAAHAGHPELGVNALRPMADFMSAALKLPDPENGTLLNIASVSAPGALNAVPDRGSFLLEIRGRDTQSVALLREKVEELLAKSGCSVFEGSAGDFEKAEVGAEPICRMQRLGRAIPVVQDKELTGLVLRAAHSLGLKTRPFSFQASDDASLLIDAMHARGGKGCYFVCGADIAAPHHNPAFDFDEAAMGDCYFVLLKALCSHY
jgi:aminobenzoyl-glutamate utilization protein A